MATADLVKGRTRGAVTAERFSQGMTFDEYVTYTGTPENLAREAGWWLGRVRHDFSGLLRTRYDDMRLTDAQLGAIRWLAAQPGGPAKILVLSEEWSSDCRRDIPALARLAEGGGLELRIFPRDGQVLGTGPRANPDESPNADLVNEFLFEKDGQTYQSVPWPPSSPPISGTSITTRSFPRSTTRSACTSPCRCRSPARPREKRRGNASSATGGCCSNPPSTRCGPPLPSIRSSPRSTSGSW